MRVTRSLLVVSIVVLLPAAGAWADCGLSSICPFGCCAAKTAPAGNIATVANTRGTSTPTVFAKVGTGTKRLVTNTKNLLSFKKPAADQRGKATYSLRSEPPKPGFFYRLFHPEPPPPPRTVDEWMSLEQIHP